MPRKCEIEVDDGPMQHHHSKRVDNCRLEDQHPLPGVQGSVARSGLLSSNETKDSYFTFVDLEKAFDRMSRKIV